MQTIRRVPDLRQRVATYRAEGARVALVPTMGALHRGHMALIAAAQRHADRVIASIFVNPRQFGPNEDLARYPRRESEDAVMLAEAGCDVLWLPTVETMYPDGFATSISVAGVTEGLDGAARPGHFDGVATVVAKLFNQVRPDVALFGEKDFQQLAVIRRMAADLDLGIEIVGVPTVREEDGLALSSRNAYLDPRQRDAAAALPRALNRCAATIGAGGERERALSEARDALTAAGFESIDYLTLVDATTLAPPTATTNTLRLLVAARLGTTRLIDNVAVVTGS